MSNNKITRRSALKMLGITTAALAAGGTSAVLESCAGHKPGKKETRDRVVLYFTGTGNSLYVAKSLSSHIVSIPAALRDKQFTIEAREIGLVYPKYGDVPQIVKDFLARATLKCNYFFVLITYGHNLKPKDPANLLKVLEGKVKVDYLNGVHMVDNRLYKCDMAQNIKQSASLGIDKAIAAIKKEIDESKHYIVEPSAPAEQPKGKDQGKKPHGKPDATAQAMFEITEACIGCGICVQVCPRGDYKVVDDVAVAQGPCERCLSCAQNCPQLAITPIMGDVNPKARYRNPNVSLRDIERSNCQSLIVSPI